MDGSNSPSGLFKEMTMSSMKTIFAAATLAVLSAVGIGSASAQAWDRHGDHHRSWRHERVEHRAYVDRMRLSRALRFHSYRMIGDPFFVHGRYVVRTHDRFGRIVFVQVDPYSGRFIRVVRL
jgi:hypothetical protein